MADLITTTGMNSLYICGKDIYLKSPHDYDSNVPIGPYINSDIGYAKFNKHISTMLKAFLPTGTTYTRDSQDYSPDMVYNQMKSERWIDVGREKANHDNIAYVDFTGKTIRYGSHQGTFGLSSYPTHAEQIIDHSVGFFMSDYILENVAGFKAFVETNGRDSLKIKSSSPNKVNQVNGINTVQMQCWVQPSRINVLGKDVPSVGSFWECPLNGSHNSRSIATIRRLKPTNSNYYKQIDRKDDSVYGPLDTFKGYKFTFSKFNQYAYGNDGKYGLAMQSNEAFTYDNREFVHDRRQAPVFIPPVTGTVTISLFDIYDQLGLKRYILRSQIPSSTLTINSISFELNIVCSRFEIDMLMHSNVGQPLGFQTKIRWDKDIQLYTSKAWFFYDTVSSHERYLSRDDDGYERKRMDGKPQVLYSKNFYEYYPNGFKIGETKYTGTSTLQTSHNVPNIFLLAQGISGIPMEIARIESGYIGDVVPDAYSKRGDDCYNFTGPYWIDNANPNTYIPDTFFFGPNSDFPRNYGNESGIGNTSYFIPEMHTLKGTFNISNLTIDPLGYFSLAMDPTDEINLTEYCTFTIDGQCIPTKEGRFRGVLASLFALVSQTVHQSDNTRVEQSRLIVQWTLVHPERGPRYIIGPPHGFHPEMGGWSQSIQKSVQSCNTICNPC